MKAVTALKDKNYGQMFFDFGNPIDLNAYFGHKLDKFKYSAEPAHVQQINGDEMMLISNLAHHVVREQQKKIIIMIFNLMALIYNERVFTKTAYSLTITAMKNRILKVIEIFEGLGAIVSVKDKNLITEIESAINIHSNIIMINSKQVIELIKANTSSHNNLLSPQIMNVAIPVFSLQLYCNPTLFWLAEPAFFVLCINDHKNISEDDLRRNVNTLRRIFIYEFVMYADFEKEDFEKTLDILLNLKVVLRTENNQFECNEQQVDVQRLLLSAIAPFLSSFLNVSKLLLENFYEHSFTEKEVFKTIQSSLEQEMIKENFYTHPYSLCLETIGTTLLSLSSQGCLVKEKRYVVN